MRTVIFYMYYIICADIKWYFNVLYQFYLSYRPSFSVSFFTSIGETPSINEPIRLVRGPDLRLSFIEQAEPLD